MLVLMIGDVVGRPGREGITRILPELRSSLGPDLVVANGENVAGGKGMTISTLQELQRAGIDVVTSGNHVWAQREMILRIQQDGSVVRPLNLPPGLPGSGAVQRKGVAVVNLVGRIFMRCFDCPFRAMDEFLSSENLPRVVVVDFHGEATSEKNALAWYLDGRVSAVLGTHTHVPTADARILPEGTAVVTDVGMVGPLHSVIGLNPAQAVHSFVTGLPAKFDVADGPVVFNSVLVEIDSTTGKATSIRRIDRVLEERR